MRLFNKFFEFYKSNKKSLSSEMKNVLLVGVTVAVIAVSVAIGFLKWSNFKPKNSKKKKGNLRLPATQSCILHQQLRKNKSKFLVTPCFLHCKLAD